MPRQSLQVSEARKRLTALVERVARGGGSIAIGRYGRERAVLVGIDEYTRLVGRARRRSGRAPSLEGTLTLACSPSELEAESHRLGELWLATFEHPPARKRKRRG
jgi:prevent-host-death family protein